MDLESSNAGSCREGRGRVAKGFEEGGGLVDDERGLRFRERTQVGGILVEEEEGEIGFINNLTVGWTRNIHVGLIRFGN